MSVSNLTHAPVSRGEGGALALSALAAVFWGTNFEATRIALVDLPPWTAASGRVAMAVAAAMLWLAATRSISWCVLRRNLVAFTVLGTIGVAGFTATLFLGMKTSSPVTAALIMGTSPLTTNLLGSVLWALYTIGCRRWIVGATPIETSAWTMLAGALVLGFVAFRLETPLAIFAHASVAAWASTLWMALVGSALALIFWQVGIARRGPGATSVVFNLVPVSALAVAAVFGRAPDMAQIAGVAIALFGIMLASGKLPGLPAGGLFRRPVSSRWL